LQIDAPMDSIAPPHRDSRRGPGRLPRFGRWREWNRARV